MAITNFIITAAAVAAVASLMSRDVRGSTSMLRRNMKQLRVWVEDAAVEAKKPVRPNPEARGPGTPVNLRA
jgi:hypothetical protein